MKHSNYKKSIQKCFPTVSTGFISLQGLGLLYKNICIECAFTLFSVSVSALGLSTPIVVLPLTVPAKRAQLFLTQADGLHHIGQALIF